MWTQRTGIAAGDESYKKLCILVTFHLSIGEIDVFAIDLICDG